MSTNWVKTTIYTHPPKGTYPNKSDMLKPSIIYNEHTVPSDLLQGTILVDADGLLFKACMDSAGMENSKSSGMEPDITKCLDKFSGLLSKSLYDLVRACEPHLSNTAAYNKVKNLEPMLFFTGRDNFRCGLYYNYKNNRKKVPTIPLEIYGEQIDEDTIKTLDGTLIINKEQRIHRIRKLLSERYLTNEYNGLEADDLISMCASMSEGGAKLIVSPDKDLLTIEGVLFNNHSSPGVLTYTDGVTAQRNFFTQCLTGDSVDCYPGIPGATGEDIYKLIEEYGPNSTTGVLSEEELADRLREIYSIVIGPTAGIGLADANMQCAYLLRESDLDKGFVRVFGQRNKWIRVG